MKVILISGSFCNEDMWQHQLKYFKSNNEIEVEVFDSTTQSTIYDMADELLKFASEKIFLVGFSLGSQIVFNYTVRIT